MERGREGQVPVEQLRRALAHHAEAVLGVPRRIIGSYLNVVIAHRVRGRATWRGEAIGYEVWCQARLHDLWSLGRLRDGRLRF